MVGIVLKHGYILHIYPTSRYPTSNINMKRTFFLSYGYTTESGESGSTNPLYGVSCATQRGKLITYGKKSQIDKCTCQHVILCPENAKIKIINTSVHHIRVKFVDTSLPSPKWYNRHYSLYWCMDHCYLVFIKKIYTIIMCLYYLDLLYNDIFYTISHYIIISYTHWGMMSHVEWG